MTRKELKSLAKLQIKGKIGILFLITIVVGLISGLASFVPLAGSILSSLILTPAFSLGLIYIYFRIASDPNYKPRVSEVFEGFSNFWPMVKVILLQGLFTFLWSLLFIVPGIIKSFSYSQAIYIIAENPNMPAMEAIRQSERMMKGKKMDYFVLGLSFFGWIFLATFTLGLLFIWLEPYMMMTMVNFYSSLKDSYFRPAAPAMDAPQPDMNNPNMQ